VLELTVRLVVSLTIVVGLLLLLARVGARKFRGSTGALVHVVHRQPLSRTSAVAVVTVGTRVLVLGTTEQQVSVLAELDPDELEVDDATVLSLAGNEGLGTGLDGLPRPAAAPVVEEGAPAPVSKPGNVPAKRAGSHRAAPAAKQPATPTGGPLVGSVLSPQTWRQALAAVRRAS
jgi:flagellar protein FliO/FliZ